MNFLLDMNLPRQLGRLLQQDGHRWRHVGDIGLHEADDIDIVAEARSQREVILTHDLDYGGLLAFSGDSSPSVVIVRLRQPQAEAISAQLRDSWSELEPALAAGAIVVLEDGVVRIRRLPIEEPA